MPGRHSECYDFENDLRKKEKKKEKKERPIATVIWYQRISFRR